MRIFLKRYAAFVLVVLSAGHAAARAQSEREQGRVVLVLPFENRSGNVSLNWIGDSFPDTLDQRLDSAGFLTISHDDRAYALDHLGLPTGFRPSRATTIRIAQQLDADYVIVGSFTVSGNAIKIQAQVLSVEELRLSPPVLDGAPLERLFDAENAVAWKVARVLDPHFSVAEATFLAAPGSVPLPAFEDYIRGSNATTSEESLKRLQSAVSIVPDYAAALLALGKQQYAAHDYAAASATKTKILPSSPLALEGNFYLGLSHFNSAGYAAAETAFGFVAARLPLPEVVNDLAVAMSRQGKNGVAYFQKASQADPVDEDYHYNLAVALFRSGDTARALSEADAAFRLKPNDNEAGALRAKLSLARPGTKLDTGTFSPLERIRRNYSETGFRQAAFQLDQMRAARMSLLPPQQQATEYSQLGFEYLGQGLLPQAEQEFQTALAADANSSLPHAGLAQVRELTGSVLEARNEALLSLKLKPNAAAYLVLARLDLAAKLLSASADDVSQALRLEPANSAAIAFRQDLIGRGQAVP